MKIEIDGKSIWINYHHLYCFFVIATEGTLTQASKNIGIGQSALSIQMQQFENQIGMTLFERSHRKIVPNERGKIVLSYAKEIFRLGTEMIETLNDRPTSNRIHLQIGALDTISKHITVQLIERAFQKLKCSVTITEGSANELLRSLTEHKIDLVVTNFFPVTDIGQLFTKKIAKLPLWVVGSKNFLNLKKGFPTSLHQQPFVVPTGDSRVRHEFDNFCKKINITPDYIAETQDIMVQKLLATKKIGLTVVPELAVREYLDNKDLFCIGKLEGVYEELFLVSATRKIENPAASYLMNKFHIE